MITRLKYIAKNPLSANSTQELRNSVDSRTSRGLRYAVQRTGWGRGDIVSIIGVSGTGKISVRNHVKSYSCTVNPSNLDLIEDTKPVGEALPDFCRRLRSEYLRRTPEVPRDPESLLRHFRSKF